MNTINNMVSLIIPVYNREAYLEECVDSVFAQSHQNFEIILIDDGSTDNTLSVCQKLADKDPRVKLLETGHVGVSAARNMGIDAAKGEFLFFLDSDDVIYPLLLETLVTAMNETGAEMAGSRVVNISENYWHKVRSLLSEEPLPSGTFFHDHAQTLDALHCGESVLRPLGGVMMRRSLVGDTRFRTDLFIGEDHYFVYENLIKGASSVGVEKKWYYCRLHANNSSWNYSFSGFWTRFFRRELVWESEEALGRPKYANIEKRNAFGCFVMCYRRNKPYSEDSRKMRKVLRKYAKVLFPALTPKAKILFLLSVSLPLTSSIIIKKQKKNKFIFTQNCPPNS